MNNDLIQTAAEAVYRALDDKLGQDIVVLDIRNLSVITDYFIIVTGKNPNHMQALANTAEEALFKAGLAISHREGQNSESWILLDYHDVIVHIFSEEDRNFYNLERIWGDATPVQFSPPNTGHVSQQTSV